MPPKRSNQRRPAPRTPAAPREGVESAGGGSETVRTSGSAPTGGPGSAPQLLYLDPKRIRVPEHRIRSRFRGDEGDSLRASVRAVNIQSPLGVKEVEGEWVLDDGENRLRIAVEEGMELVPCVVTVGTMRDVIRANVSSLNKGVPNPLEMITAMAALHEAEGIEFWELAEWAGKSDEWLDRMLMVLAASPAVKQPRAVNQ